MSYDHASYNQAERAVVAAAILDPSVLQTVALEAINFFDFKLQAIWRAIGQLLEESKPVDVVSLEYALGDKLPAVGGLSFLSELVISPGSANNVLFYADVVREGYSRRELLKTLSEVRMKLESGADLDKVYGTIGSMLDRYHSTGTATGLSLADHAKLEIARIEQGQPAERGLPTGLGIELIVPGGIPRDKVTILFGETGNYKTTTKDNLIDAFAAAGHRVINFTLEDNAQLTVQCALARLTGIPYSRIWSGQLAPDELRRLRSAGEENATTLTRMLTIDNIPPTIDQVIMTARKLAREAPISAVFIDYIQLLDYCGEPEPTALKYICKKAQQAARQDNMAYILLSQLNAEKMRQRDDHRPQLSDLFGSSAMSQMCKLAIATYRPSKYAPAPKESEYKALVTSDPDGKRMYDSTIELWVLKNRVGDSDVCVRTAVEPTTGKMQPYPDLGPVRRVGAGQLRSA